jgi:hypothetical protein
MIVEPAPSGARGVDTILTFGPSRAKAIKDAGFDFVIRYLGTLTMLERNVLLNAGLALLAVTYSRRAGWQPNTAVGDSDGQHAVQNARMAGLPEGMSLFLDVEGPHGKGADVIGYVNAWATRVIAGGYRAGIYVGYGIPLTDQQMYYSLKVTGYWDSCSKNVGVAVRGFQMVQEYPGNQKIAALQVDVNRIQADLLGCTPNWLIGDP